MLFFKKKKILATHDGSFHADDVFAAAALSIMLGKKNEPFKIIRTRDEEIIKSADYVFDLGGIYNPENNRFDHHQPGGAGKHEKGLSAQAGIEYSSFGLVWKKYGEEICGSKKSAEMVDNKLVAPIDADDNGFDLIEKKYKISPYLVQDVLSIFRPTSLENMDKDRQFRKALTWAKEILSREIKKTNDQIEITKIIQNFYKNTGDKRLIVIDKPKVSRYEVWDALQDFSEPLFVVYGVEEKEWRVAAMRSDYNSFENRENLPKAWAGLRDKEFQKVSGVSDAIFCHRGLFLAGAKSKEGAIKLAELALS
jgi:uncharacterized UPF0160 family protein